MPDNHAQGGSTGEASKETSSQGGGATAENAGGGSSIKFGGGDTGSTGEPNNNGSGQSDFLASLSEENRAVAQQKGWTSFDDAFKGYRSLESAFSGRNQHDNGQSNQGGDKEYRAGDYVFSKPQNASDIGYNDQFAEQLKVWAVKAKASPEQAQVIHDGFVEFAGASIAGNAEAAEQAVTTKLRDTEKSLTEKWGTPNTPQFQRNVQLAERAANKLGITDALKEAGVFVQRGNDTNVANAEIFEALAKVGNAMYAEDELHGTANAGVNPFEKIEGNERTVSELVRNDPEKARMLIQQLPADKRARWGNTLKSLETRIANQR